ncbi:MAG TPA: hypothetical protein VK615_09440 [Candidatus Binatia bacterium]|nr:hypothetical protein [Candidatus Binatia bacterium]
MLPASCRQFNQFCRRDAGSTLMPSGPEEALLLCPRNTPGLAAAELTQPLASAPPPAERLKAKV